MKYWIGYAFAAVLLLSACSDDKPEQDLVRPSITWLGILPDSQSGGTKLTLTYGVADNAGLSQLKLEIHDNFDGHAHQKGSVLPFSWDSIINLQGLTQQITIDVNLPADIAAGNYDILAQAIDMSGNEAAPLIKNIYLKNALDSELPKIENAVWNPVPVSGVIALSGDNVALTLQADVSDNLALDKVELKVIRESDEKMVYDFDEEAPSSAYQFTKQINFSAAWGSGSYHVVLKVKDGKGNVSEEEVEVDYTP